MCQEVVNELDIKTEEMDCPLNKPIDAMDTMEEKKKSYYKVSNI